METDPRPLIIFHGDNCMDGLMSAYTLWRRYFDRADYHPAKYGEAPPDCRDRLVYILDFCYAPDVTAVMADEATRIVILDHHKTAIEKFKASWVERHDVEVHFDTERSGAGLTADYLNGKSRIWMQDYAEDRDLWRFKLPYSKEINAAMAAATMGKELFESFRILNEMRGQNKNQLIARGEGALAQIECYVRQVTRHPFRTTFAGYPTIPVVNVPKPMNSEVLNELAKRAPFAVGWHQDGGNAVFSLRSQGTPGFDVAKLAEQYGGGGHHNAAGFKMPLREAIDAVYGTAPRVLR